MSHLTRLPPTVLALATALLFVPAFAGCSSNDSDGTQPGAYQALGFTGEPTGLDADAWPDLEGELVILDHGAFAAFEVAAAQFHNLTGVTARHDAADDAGSALQRAIDERGDPIHDVVYGIDNVLMGTAEDARVLAAYEPIHANRITPRLVFYNPGASGWIATPVDHGTIAVNWDPRAPGLEGADIRTFEDILAHADEFVTEDPRTSSPGLGFLLATIDRFGDGDGAQPSWQEYWADLLDGGALVTTGWTEAYEQHFTAGYNSASGLSDRALVTSYTTSPAYEAYYGRPAADLARLALGPGTTWHQVQTMAILDGAPHRAAAEAWVEYTLTDHFQGLAAPWNAVYPAVADVDTDSVYGAIDPEPASFIPSSIPYQTVADNLPVWLDEWTDVYEAHIADA